MQTAEQVVVSPHDATPTELAQLACYDNPGLGPAHSVWRSTLSIHPMDVHTCQLILHWQEGSTIASNSRYLAERAVVTVTMQRRAAVHRLIRAASASVT